MARVSCKEVQIITSPIGAKFDHARVSVLI
jgi:hypothetical protein